MQNTDQRIAIVQAGPSRRIAKRHLELRRICDRKSALLLPLLQHPADPHGIRGRRIRSRKPLLALRRAGVKRPHRNQAQLAKLPGDARPAGAQRTRQTLHPHQPKTKLHLLQYLPSLRRHPRPASPRHPHRLIRSGMILDRGKSLVFGRNRISPRGRMCLLQVHGL